MDPRRLRILLVTHGLPPESVGGVEQHVDGLARALVARGHEVHVYAKTGRPDVAQATQVEDPADLAPYRTTRFAYRYEGLESLQSMYAVPLLDDAMRAFLAAQPEPFDIAHVHHLTGVSTGVLSVLREAGTATVLTLHDYWLLCPRGQMWHRDGTVTRAAAPERCADCLRPTFGGWIPDGAAGERVVAQLLAHARGILEVPDALVVPSARATLPFEALGVPHRRFQVVENGVDTQALRGLPPPGDDPTTPLRIGYLGTLIPSKGLDVLVRALQRLSPGAAELHVHGNVVPYHGDDGYLTRTWMGLRPFDRLHYHGPYRTADLPQILAGIDVLAAPALWEEAFGLTVREALAAGRPVVASRIGGLQDALTDGEHGWLVPPGDVDALAAVLGRLAADRAELARAARACRERLHVRGFDAMAGELLELYARLGRRP